MSQARRIKPKPKKQKKLRPPSNLPWGLLFVILVSGIALGVLLNGAFNGSSSMGSGLRALFEQMAEEDKGDPDISHLIETKSTKKEFEFYELLPEIEKIMPDDLADDTVEKPRASVIYFIQVASFRAHADAETLRASLALKGYKSETQMREVAGKGIYYRVRLGPYDRKRKAKNVRQSLLKLGVDPMVYSVKK